MKPTARLLSTAVFGLICLIHVGVGSAQDPATTSVDGHAQLESQRWGKLSKSEAGKAFYVEGRWLECSGDQVILVDLSAEQRGFLFINPNSRLQRRLTQDVTAEGESLVRRKSKARVFGTAKSKGAGVVLEVSKVTVLKGDKERLAGELNALGASDPAPYAALAAEARMLGERYDDSELKSLAITIARRQAKVEADLLDTSDVSAALALAKRMLAANDRLGAIALLAKVDEALPDGVSKAELHRELKALGATQSGGEWHSFEAFKAAEGFVQTEDKRWVRPEELEFKAVVDEEIEAQGGTIVLVRENPVEAGRAAKAGRLKRGQNMAEARIAVGMPKRVAHVTRKNPLGEEVLWTQWIAKDGRRAYFMNGDLVRVVGQ